MSTLQWVAIVALVVWAPAFIFAAYLLAPWRLEELVREPEDQPQPTARR